MFNLNHRCFLFVKCWKFCCLSLGSLPPNFPSTSLTPSWASGMVAVVIALHCNVTVCQCYSEGKCTRVLKLRNNDDKLPLVFVKVKFWIWPRVFVCRYAVTDWLIEWMESNPPFTPLNVNVIMWHWQEQKFNEYIPATPSCMNELQRTWSAWSWPWGCCWLMEGNQEVTCCYLLSHTHHEPLLSC